MRRQIKATIDALPADRLLVAADFLSYPCRSSRCLLNNANLIVRQPVKPVDKLINLPVGRVNLPLGLLATLGELLGERGGCGR